jgi:hypothetical protein
MHKAMALCVESCGTKSGNGEKNSSESPACCANDCILNKLGYLNNDVFDAEMTRKSVADLNTDNQWSNEVSFKSKYI